MKLALPTTRLAFFSKRDFWRAPLAAGAILAAGVTLLRTFPFLCVDLFARGTAEVAGLLLGLPVLRVEPGWALPSTRFEPVLVSASCSGTDFWLILTALVGWNLVQVGRVKSRAAAAALLATLPLVLTINALRIVAVVQAHRWFIPLWPSHYHGFWHQLAGIAVFVPSLVVFHAYLTPARKSVGPAC